MLHPSPNANPAEEKRSPSPNLLDPISQLQVAALGCSQRQRVGVALNPLCDGCASTGVWTRGSKERTVTFVSDESEF